MLLHNYVPGLKYGAKILASEVLSVGGQPQVGNVWYVDPVNGSDTNNNGKAWNSAFATLSGAHSAATDNNYDVIVIAPAGTGTGSGTSVGGALTFSKNLITVVGAAAPTYVSQRSRILVDSTAYSLTISGNGNRFLNVQLGCFVNVNVPFTLTGDRNYFGGVHFAGMGDGTAAASSSGRSLYINDGDENLFDNCVIGLDTTVRTTTNTELEFAGGCQRNTFDGCQFVKFTSSAGSTFIKSTGASGLDRWQRFNNATFYSFSTNNATALTAAIDVSAQTTTAHLIMSGRQLLIGATDWEATASNRLFFEPYTATQSAIGIGINQTT